MRGILAALSALNLVAIILFVTSGGFLTFAAFGAMIVLTFLTVWFIRNSEEYVLRGEPA